MLNRIISKVTSGQWILTLVSSLAFAYCACKSIIPPEATTALLGMVFTSYFKRDRTKDNGHS